MPTRSLWHAPLPRLLLKRRCLHRRYRWSHCWLFRSAGRIHGFRRQSARHCSRSIDDSRWLGRTPAIGVLHMPTHGGLLLHHRRFFLLGNVLANLPGSLLRHAFKSTHQNRLLNTLFDFRAPHMGTGSHGGKLHHGHGGISVSPPMMLLPRWHLVGVHGLHLPLGHRLTTGLLHLGARWPSLMDKRMPTAVAGHDLRHIHAVLEDRGLPSHGRIDVDVGRAHKLGRVDEGVAGGAEAVA